MTLEELQEIVASLATTVSTQERTYEYQERLNIEAFNSLRATAESQARSIESLRETGSANTQIVADSLELAAAAQRSAAAAQETAAAAQITAAAIMEQSANTARNIDRLEQNIDRLEKIVEIIIKDNQADRERIRNLEDRS